jgi:cation diffusion facilitator family transporter
MQGSRKVVYAGLASNLAIAIVKLVVAIVSGSSAMLAEFFHSTVDTGNSLLLLYGMHRSRRPADRGHAFGHGKELYFWSFVVAVSMFAVGAVLSIWEGISHIRRPEAITNSFWTYLVLGFSVLFSVGSLVVAVREANRRKGSDTLVEYIRASKDPTVFTVILEDIGDVAGQVIALIAIFLSVKLHNPLYDGLGSIAVGLVILALSFVLATESRKLLVGETAPSKHVQRMKQLLEEDQSVERVGDLLTMQLGPDDILLNVEIEFRRQSCIDDLEQTIDRLERRIQQEFPQVHHLFLEVARISRDSRSLPGVPDTPDARESLDSV